MPKPLTAEDILPLAASLGLQERLRLLRLLSEQLSDDAACYSAAPPNSDEFTCDEDPLSWDADGWEGVD